MKHQSHFKRAVCHRATLGLFCLTTSLQAKLIDRNRLNVGDAGVVVDREVWKVAIRAADLPENNTPTNALLCRLIRKVGRGVRTAPVQLREW